MSTTTNEQSDDPTKALKANERKWTPTLMRAGWTVLPTVIIERQQALGLDSLDVNILLHLASRWWVADRKPYPAKKTIASAMGVSPRTVQRRIAALEGAGFIQRERRQGTDRGTLTNIYHFDGLIEAAKPYAKELIEERQRRERERQQRARRKGPARLQALKGGKGT